MEQVQLSSAVLLKQATPYAAIFEHLFAPGTMIEQFSNNLKDLPHVAGNVLKRLDSPEAHTVLDAVEQRQALAAVMLNKWMIIESLAESLQSFAEHMSWTTTLGTGYTLVPFNKCCKFGAMPQQLVELMQMQKQP